MDFDYLILGTGMGGLSTAALLAKRGRGVCMLEAHSRVGGLTSRIKKGDYSFSAGAQYLMGAEMGGPINRFLKEINLENDIYFNSLGPDYFDVVRVPTGEFRIPFGHVEFKNKLIQYFPKERESIDKFISLIVEMFEELNLWVDLPDKWDVLLHPIKSDKVLRYRNYTLQQMFDELEFSQELQAIIAGRMGNVSEAPRDASLIAYGCMMIYYGKGAHYPQQGMAYLPERIAAYIKTQPGCQIILEQPVKSIRIMENGFVVATNSGETYRARNLISNIDPKVTMKMISNQENRVNRFLDNLDYEYSDALFQICLGLKGVDIAKYGFGNWNFWHLAGLDPNKEYNDLAENKDFSHPWLFIASPSRHANPGTVAPEGGETLEVLTFVDYDYFKKIHLDSRQRYEVLIQGLTETMLNVLDKNYLPNVRKYIKEIVVRDPISIEKELRKVKSNVYGSRLNPKNVSLSRLTYKSPIANLYFTGATVASPGVHGVISGSMKMVAEIEN